MPISPTVMGLVGGRCAPQRTWAVLPCGAVWRGTLRSRRPAPWMWPASSRTAAVGRHGSTSPDRGHVRWDHPDDA